MNQRSKTKLSSDNIASEIFDLIQKQSDDWWTGSINNRIGVFPATHVKVLGSDGGQSGITGISAVLARKWREKTRKKDFDSESPPRPPPRRPLGSRPVPSPPKLRFRPPLPTPRDYPHRHRSVPLSSRLEDVYIPISRVQNDTFIPISQVPPEIFTPISRHRDEDVYIPISRARAPSPIARPRAPSPISHDEDDDAAFVPTFRAQNSISETVQDSINQIAQESISNHSSHSREDIENVPDDTPIVDGAAALSTEKSNNCNESEDEDDDAEIEEGGNSGLELLLTQIDSLNDRIGVEQEKFERECLALDAKNAREMAEIKEKHRNEKNKMETLGKQKIKDLKKLLERLTNQVEKAGRWSREVQSEDTSLGQELECPVCLVEMRPPTRIWQCGSGHTLCEDCKNRKEVTRCPTCRRGFTGRAIAMERLISTFFNQR